MIRIIPEIKLARPSIPKIMMSASLDNSVPLITDWKLKRATNIAKKKIMPRRIKAYPRNSWEIKLDFAEEI